MLSAFFCGGCTLFGGQSGDFVFTTPIWRGGELRVEGAQTVKDGRLHVDLTLTVDDELLERFASDDDEIGALLTIERFFDENGRANAINNEYFSTVLTAGGVPIEFSEREWGAPSKYNVHGNGLFMTMPVDTWQSVKINDIQQKDALEAEFSFNEDLSALPAGLWRPRIYFFYNRAGTPESKKASSKNALTVAHQILFPRDEKFLEKKAAWSSANDYGELQEKFFYLPMFKIGAPAVPKMPWVLFASEASQGSRGVVSTEDVKNFQISTREITQTTLILEPGDYSLDPAMPLVAQFDSALRIKNERIPLVGGFLEGEIVQPNGEILPLPRREFTDFRIINEKPFATGERIAWLAATAPANNISLQKTGKYEIRLNGEMRDEFNNIYAAGGTYVVYVGNKITFSSAVKPGTPFFVGDQYFPRMAYFPPFKGKITFKFAFFPFDSTKPPEFKEITQDNLEGGFNPPPIPLDTPGEYHVSVLAEAHHLLAGDFYGAYDAAAVVVPRENTLTIHGKIGGKFADGTVVSEPRFRLGRNPLSESRREFFSVYNSGDLLKVASNQNNAIDNRTEAYNESGEKITVVPRAKNHWQPFNFPELIEKNAYLFVSAEKPGMIVRNYVASEFISDTFWSVRGQNFANRLNGSLNGDLENDVYRNFSTVVFQSDDSWESGFHVTNIAILAEGDLNDRVVEPFSEPFVFSNGQEHLFLIGTGLEKPVGAVFSQYLHVFPAIKGVKIALTLTDPQGIKKDFPVVETDDGGFTPVGESVPLNLPGVYRVDISAEFKGKKDRDFYKVYVLPKEIKNLNLGIPFRGKFSVESGLKLIGKIPVGAKNVRVDYEIIMPGAFLDSNEAGIGEFVQKKDEFTYFFDPRKIHAVYKNYDLNPLSRMVFMYFYLTGDVEGKPFYQFERVMIRGDSFYSLGLPPAGQEDN